MSDWQPKRFWTDTTVAQQEDGWTVLLDGRSVKTPAKAHLIVPSQACAELIRGEWDAQAEKVDPNTMPFTRMANASIDKVEVQKAEVADMLAEYGATDLLCYRADAPDDLVLRQRQIWDPYLDWADATYGARLTPVAGVMFAEQSNDALARLRMPLDSASAFELAALYDLIQLSGSLVLGLAASQTGDLDAIWAASRLDEMYQAEKWGQDEEAEAQSAIKKRAFFDAHKFFAAVRSTQADVRSA